MMALTLVAATLLSLVCVRICMAVSRRLTFVDHPGAEAHKQHARAIPYGGGIGMAIAFLVVFIVTWLLVPGQDAHDLLLRGRISLPMLIGAAALFLLGLWDDLHRLRAGVKVVIQGVICALTIWSADLGIDSLRDLPWLSYGLAWIWLMLVTNAYNLLDHADGLSAAVALVSAGVLLIGSLGSDDHLLASVWIILMGCLAGFLVWNLPPARIYMGDSGSLPLGFIIGIGTLTVTFWPSAEGGSPLAVLSPLLITAIPLFDTAVVIVKRLRRGKPVYVGDRNHISHRLSRLGVGPRASLAAIVALQISLAAGALQLRTQEWTPGLVVLAQSAAILLAVILLETSRGGDD